MDSTDQTRIHTLDDGSVVVPVLEEELVVTKRRRVRERVVVRRRTETRPERVRETLLRETVDVDADGDVVFDGERARPADGVMPDTEVPLRGLLTVDDIPTLRNVPVLAPDGEQLGHVGDVEYDEATRRIHTVGVSGGLLGLRRVDVPAEGAVLAADGLHVTATRAELEERRAGSGTGSHRDVARAERGGVTGGLARARGRPSARPQARPLAPRDARGAARGRASRRRRPRPRRAGRPR